VSATSGAGIGTSRALGVDAESAVNNLMIYDGVFHAHGTGGAAIGSGPAIQGYSAVAYLTISGGNFTVASGSDPVDQLRPECRRLPTSTSRMAFSTALRQRARESGRVSGFRGFGAIVGVELYNRQRNFLRAQRWWCGDWDRQGGHGGDLDREEPDYHGWQHHCDESERRGGNRVGIL
jgi:hypothetical protein